MMERRTDEPEADGPEEPDLRDDFGTPVTGDNPSPANSGGGVSTSATKGSQA